MLLLHLFIKQTTSDSHDQLALGKKRRVAISKEKESGYFPAFSTATVFPKNVNI